MNCWIGKKPLENKTEVKTGIQKRMEASSASSATNWRLPKEPLELVGKDVLQCRIFG